MTVLFSIMKQGFFFLLLLLPSWLCAVIKPDAVWVLVNSKLPDSVALGEYYIRQRNIPEEHLIALPMTGSETISWDSYLETIYHPLIEVGLERGFLEGSLSERKDAVGRRAMLFLGNHLEALVLCKGVPMRIHEDQERVNAQVKASIMKTVRSSVDSELAALPLGEYEISGVHSNPLFRKDPSSLCLDAPWPVMRLDGPNYADARALVDRAMKAEKDGMTGRAYVDIKGPHAQGDTWLRQVRDLMRADGWDVSVHDQGGVFGLLDRFDRPLFYFGWYKQQFTGAFLRKGFEFPPGAIALHIHSFSAQTLNSDTEYWCGPLVAHGVTVTFGNVSEPYLGLTVWPQMVYEGFSKGMCAGEVMLYAHPVLSWQTIMLGDPLDLPNLEVDGASRNPYQRIRSYLKDPHLSAWRTLVVAAEEEILPVLALFVIERAGTEAWEALPEGFLGSIPVPASVEFEYVGAWNSLANAVSEGGESEMAWAIWDSLYLASREDPALCHSLLKSIRTQVGGQVFKERYSWQERWLEAFPPQPKLPAQPERK